jgi:hypothetical protein
MRRLRTAVSKRASHPMCTLVASRSTRCDHPLGRGSVPQSGRSAQFKQKTPPHRAEAPKGGASRIQHMTAMQPIPDTSFAGVMK